MNRKALEQKDHIKYLGILMDEHLKWKEQITSVSKKISRGIGILSKLKNCLEPKMLKNIYYSLVYSHLSYGIHVWGSACPTVLEKNFILQKKAVRILSGNQYFQVYREPAGPLPSSDPLFKDLEILKIFDIFKLNIANFVYLTLANESPQIFSDWFVHNHAIHNHITKSNAVITQDNFFDVGSVELTKTLHTRGSKLANYGSKLIKVFGPI